MALDCAVDTSTASGEVVANVMASFAQFERRLISQRTKDALAAKRAQGVQLGRRRTMPASVVSLIKEWRADGMSFSQIAERLNEQRVPTAQGGKRWYASTVRAVVVGRGGRAIR